MAIDISRFKTCKVIVIGDLMIDEFIWGTVERISREAPVPVVTMQEDRFSLGGAGNVAHNLASLGAKVAVVGLIGSDANAKIMMDTFGELGIDTSGITMDDQRDTSKKIRVFASSQQLLQIDRETFKPLSTATESALISSIRKLLPQADIIMVVDQGKGTITRPLLTEIISLANTNNKVSIVDPNGAHCEKYTGATILTPNVKEVALETGIAITNKATLFKAGSEYLKKSRVEGLLVTCGKEGIVIFGRSAQPFPIESEPQEVYDVTGAKDTLVSVLALALATGGSFKDSATVANVAAGLVVEKLGPGTVTEKELILKLMAYSGGSQDNPLFLKKDTLY